MPHRCGPAAFSTPWSDKCLLLISTKCTCKFTRVFLSAAKQNGVSTGSVSHFSQCFSYADSGVVTSAVKTWCIVSFAIPRQALMRTFPSVLKQAQLPVAQFPVAAGYT